MKRWILLLLVCAMLAGCGTEKATEPTAVTDPSAVTEPPTEPSLLTEEEPGLSHYQLKDDLIAGILPWGQDRYALFTTSGKLHLLTGDNLVEQKSRAENYYVKKLNYLIEKNYSQKLSLAQIAREFDISLSYLSSVYSAVTRESFSKALLRVRMTKAKELIDRSEGAHV